MNSTILEILLLFLTIVILFMFMYFYSVGSTGSIAHFSGQVGKTFTTGVGHVSNLMSVSINMYTICLLLAVVFLLIGICVAPASVGTATILIIIASILFNIAIFLRCRRC